MTFIKDQGQCGSCWAFSVTGALEGAKFKQDGSLVSFSEQQLMDCSASYGNMGCNGGFMENAMWYVIDNGITTESKYPYKAMVGACHEADKDWQIRDCTAVTPLKEKSLMAAIAQQPTSVAIEANHLSFQLYKSGVYNGNCGTKLDHGVLAVGYGTIDKKEYYKVKNSWGSKWGSNGYIYIIRNSDGKGKCGIQM